MNRNTIFYIIVTSLFILLLWLILTQGKSLESGIEIGKSPRQLLVEEQAFSIHGLFIDIKENLQHSLAILILQIISIVLIARILGWIMIKIHQPVVIGEILAGILLGPSLLGSMFPSFSGFLFPPASFNNLHILSQIGLIMFMFIIGMELDLSVIRRSASSAVVISHASIVFPYFLGVCLAYFMYRDYAPEHISFISFALFMGIAMSITAFPVLARIVQEKNLTKTNLGIFAITCAAIDDVTAWCLLALVIAIAKAGTLFNALVTLLLTVIFIVFMFSLVKPLWASVANKYFTKETIHKNIVALVFAFILLSSFITESIGIHALFGAFLAGVVMPSDTRFRMVLAQKIEDFSLVLLLPLFFVLTGLRTEIGLLTDLNQWLVCLGIILVATIGKFLGGSFSARFVGHSWKESLLLGTLMNTRGLMELIVLNIGYELGILTPEVFAMLVIMALATTFLTGPLMQAINYLFDHPISINGFGKVNIPDFNILISFGSPETGKRLLHLAHHMNFKSRNANGITALHLTPSTDFSIREAEIFEKEGFEPILSASSELGIKILTQYKATNDVDREIIQYANTGHFDLMLVGSSRPLFSKDETGGKARYFFEDINCPVGVMIDKGFTKINHVLLIIDNHKDLNLTILTTRLLNEKDKYLTILDTNDFLDDDYLLSLSKNIHKDQLKRISQVEKDQNFYNQFDLAVISVDFWDKSRIQQNTWLNFSPSLLIVNLKD
jgi:Kef-type K+ transport system membrane component KefB